MTVFYEARSLNEKKSKLSKKTANELTSLLSLDNSEPLILNTTGM